VAPFELRTFEHGGLTLSYEVHGSGPHTVVYLHGILLDSHSNRRLAADLAALGHRVILVDLPGHGRSDKPRHAAEHRMDAYAEHVVALLEEVATEPVVLGGMSLGADVSLQVAVRAPERLAALVLEMPVLEQATPGAALLFTPLLLATHYAAPVLRVVSGLARRLPREHLGALDQVLGALILEPEEMAAVLHGILVGPVAPTAAERRALTMPALVIGHRSDQLHPFGDAAKLAKQLPEGRLVEAGNLFELRLHPARLTAEIADFLGQVWAEQARSRRRSA
jgi:pimeloyl-ACP methyl ester carboxylesterase